MEWNVVAAVVVNLRELFYSIRPVDVETHEAAIALAEAHGFSFDDSLIVVSALQNRCETLLTEGLQAGWRIGSLVIANPFAPKA